jgi:hypothetical protein
MKVISKDATANKMRLVEKVDLSNLEKGELKITNHHFFFPGSA